MAKPRAYTAAEMRKMLLDYINQIRDYWLTVDVSGKEFQAQLAKDGEARYRMDGFIHSMLVMFDGGSMAMPALDITPSPHESDEQYHKDQGENWWPDDVIINDVQLHDEWNAMGRTTRNAKG